MTETLNILLLILVANGAPVMVSYLVSHKLSLPVDFGYKLKDQQYIFGNTKTWRGLNSSLFLTGVMALLLGYDFGFGLVIAVLAMSGDLISSFIKRRLKKESSSQVLLLDQLPESVLPVMILLWLNRIDLTQVIVIVVSFFIIELVLSSALFHLGVRKRPY